MSARRSSKVPSEGQSSHREKDETLKWFVFENKMRDIVQETVAPLFTQNEYITERIDGLSKSIQGAKQQIDNLERFSDDHTVGLKRAEGLYARIDNFERELTKSMEKLTVQVNNSENMISIEKQKLNNINQESKAIDEKITKLVNNVNHSRETFLDLKGNVFQEIGKLKEAFSQELQEVSYEIQQNKTYQTTCASQLSNHTTLLNELDTVLEKMNMDISHKFNMTIKGLQEDKLDQKIFYDKFKFIHSNLNQIGDQVSSIQNSDQTIKSDLFKLINANMQVELFNLMNTLFPEETEQKQNMRKYLAERFQNLVPRKTEIKTTIVKRKIHTHKPGEVDEDNESPEYMEEVIKEEVERDLDLTEITPQILERFEEIKQTTFDSNNENFSKDQEELKNNHERVKKEKAEEEQQKIHIALERLMNHKY